MFDIAWTEMLVLAIIIVVVVGPRDLPKVMRSIAGFMRKARALASQFQSDMDQLARESEIEELRKQARSYQEKFRQPMRDLDKLVDPTTGERVDGEPAAPKSESHRSETTAETAEQAVAEPSTGGVSQDAADTPPAEKREPRGG